jgi:AraC family ethanolamine operon transcriptional activator
LLEFTARAVGTDVSPTRGTVEIIHPISAGNIENAQSLIVFGIMDNTSQHYIRSTRLSNVLDLARIARGINMEITQLDPGAFESDVIQLKVHNVLASRISTSRRLRLQGNLKFLSLSFLSGGSGLPTWHGHAVTPSDLLAADAGEEFDLVVPAGIQAYCVSVIGDAEVTLRHLGGPVLAGKLSGSGYPIPCDPDMIQQLGDWFTKRYEKFDVNTSMTGGSALKLKQAFLRRLAACLRTGTRASSLETYTSTGRVEAVQRVEQHLLGDLTIPQTVDELCRYAGTSRRTLEYAFKDYFGTSPKQFVKALRLNAARNDLLFGQYGTEQVATIAVGWGFTHMGQFSADYRRMFGENPSKTLRRKAP